MKVLVIGGAGKSGRAVVEQALAAGHGVTAFVHRAPVGRVEDLITGLPRKSDGDTF